MSSTQVVKFRQLSITGIIPCIIASVTITTAKTNNWRYHEYFCYYIFTTTVATTATITTITTTTTIAIDDCYSCTSFN